MVQGYNARIVNCSSLWAEFVNKNRGTRVRLVSEEVKALNFENFDNSHNSFQYFIDFICENGFHARDSTLQYKRCVHL